MSILKKIHRFVKRSDGATAVEYAVLLALILMAVIAAISTVGVGTGGMWSNNSSEIDSVM